MSKKQTDRERILAFAFRATTEELVDAISVLKAAHAAKAGGRGAPRPVVARPARKPVPTDLNKPASTGGE